MDQKSIEEQNRGLEKIAQDAKEAESRSQAKEADGMIRGAGLSGGASNPAEALEVIYKAFSAMTRARWEAMDEAMADAATKSRNKERIADIDKKTAERRADTDRNNAERRADIDKKNAERSADIDKKKAEQDKARPAGFFQRAREAYKSAIEKRREQQADKDSKKQGKEIPRPGISPGQTDPYLATMAALRRDRDLLRGGGASHGHQAAIADAHTRPHHDHAEAQRRPAPEREAQSPAREAAAMAPSHQPISQRGKADDPRFSTMMTMDPPAAPQVPHGGDGLSAMLSAKPEPAQVQHHAHAKEQGQGGGATDNASDSTGARAAPSTPQAERVQAEPAPAPQASDPRPAQPMVRSAPADGAAWRQTHVQHQPAPQAAQAQGKAPQQREFAGQKAQGQERPAQPISQRGKADDPRFATMMTMDPPKIGEGQPTNSTSESKDKPHAQQTAQEKTQVAQEKGQEKKEVKEQEAANHKAGAVERAHGATQGKTAEAKSQVAQVNHRANAEVQASKSRLQREVVATRQNAAQRAHDNSKSR
ncbi:hypothetical protein THICB3510067 [Thiomonas sp. CB3]|nr:hypothetical protein THICB3510067 [Thiomonas sp. CB3]